MLLRFCSEIILRFAISVILGGLLTSGYAQTLDVTFSLDTINTIDKTLETPALPDIWNRTGKTGQSQYTVPFQLSRAPTELWGLYIPRAGNRLQITLNDRLLVQLGAWGQTQFDYAQIPHYVLIPKDYLQQGGNKLVIVIEGDKSRYAGLSHFYMAPHTQLKPIYNWRYFFQTSSTLSVIFICLIFAIFGLGLVIRLKEKQFWLFTASCVLCAIRTSYAVLDTIPIPYPAWAWIVDTSYVCFVACMAAFCLQELSLKKAWLIKVIYLYLALCISVISAYAILLLPPLRQAWNLLTFMFVGVMSFTFIAAWYRQRTSTSASFAVASAFAITMGLYDHWLVYYSRDGYGGFTLVRYALVPFLLAMAWVMTDRLLRQVQKEKALRLSVEQELNERKQELTQEYEVKAKLLATQAHFDERKRLLQDLHDGMGLQLNSLLGMVEQGTTHKDDLRTEVRTTIEQLRVLMDGSDSFDGTLPELFGHIRYRIETRLNRQNIQLLWQVKLPTMDLPLQQDAALSLQRLIFEFCTNVIKHAQAHCITLAAWIDGETLQLNFVDDGRGYVEANQGAGTLSIQRRVQELSAAHVCKSIAPQGLSHQLKIPVRVLILSPE